VQVQVPSVHVCVYPVVGFSSDPAFVRGTHHPDVVDHNKKGITTIVYFRSGLSLMVLWGLEACCEMRADTWAKAERNTFRTHNGDTTLYSNVCCVVLCCFVLCYRAWCTFLVGGRLY